MMNFLASRYFDQIILTRRAVYQIIHFTGRPTNLIPCEIWIEVQKSLHMNKNQHI